MLDGVGEDIGLSLAVATGVLLRTQNDGLGAIEPVDAVDDGIKAFHLLELLGVEVKQVQLDGNPRHNVHEDDPGFLVMVALTIHLLKHFESRLHNLDSAVGRHRKACFHETVILRQIFTERIGIEEDADDGG